MRNLARTMLKKHIMMYVQEWNTDAKAKADEKRAEYADDTGSM